MPIDLATAETNALRRHSPRRNRWPQLAAIEAHLVDLEARRGDAGERLREQHEQHANEPTAHAEMLASWELSDRKGARPVSQRPVLEQAIADAEAEAAGLDVAVGRELADKAAFVEKHRARLVKDADKATAEAHERAVALIDELAAARAALVELRATATWAALYPGEQAARGPREALIAGGLAKPVKDTLGVDVAFEHARILAALRADADYWRTAATREQRAAMQGVSDSDRAGGAAWTGTPEGSTAERAEKDAAIKRYTETWGEPPS